MDKGISKETKLVQATTKEKAYGAILKKTLVFLIVFAMLAGTIASAGTLKAYANEDKTEARSCSFKKKKVTIYSGNTVKLKYKITGDEGGDEYYYYYPYFESSDYDIVSVDYEGRVTGKKEGTATITLTYGEAKATCTVVVKPGDLKLKASKKKLYVGQQFKVTVKSGSLEATSVDYELYDERGNSAWSGVKRLSSTKNSITFLADKAGSYILEMGIRTAKKQYYTARTKLTILPCGPKTNRLAVAVGAKIPLELDNAEVVSFKLVDRPEDLSEYDYDDDRDDDYYDYDDYDYDDEDEGEDEEDDSSWYEDDAKDESDDYFDDWSDYDEEEEEDEMDWSDYGNWRMDEFGYWYQIDSKGNRLITDYDFSFDDGYVYFGWGLEGAGFYTYEGEYVGKTYSGYTIAIVENSLSETDKAFARAESMASGTENLWSDFSRYEVGDYADGKANYKKGKLSGVNEGVAFAELEYKTAYGKTKKMGMLIYVTNPIFKEYGRALKAGEAVSVSFTGGCDYSAYSMSSSDEKIIDVVEDDDYSYYKDRGYFKPLAYGQATITVVIDGKKFSQKVKVYNPKFNVNMAILKKGKAKQLSVSGIPDNSEVKYKSSDKSVVKVSANGRISAKKDGSALITAVIDGVEAYCSVTVGSGEGIKAVAKAQEVIGATYSQDRRMEKGYYDCSSLAWRSYHDAGIDIGGNSTYAPTAAGLAEYLEKEGKAVAHELCSTDLLLPGDLIFYAGSRDNGRYLKIDHVAIYAGTIAVGGSGTVYSEPKIIHASHGVELGSYYHRSGDVVLIARPTAKVRSD